MALIRFTESQIVDLVDEIRRSEYPLPLRAPVYGLRKLSGAVNQALSNHVVLLPAEHQDYLNSTATEIDRLLEILDEWAFSDHSPENDQEQNLEEIAETLEDEMESFWPSGEFCQETYDEDKIDELIHEITQIGWEAVGLLKQWDFGPHELAENWERRNDSVPAISSSELCDRVYEKAIAVALAEWAEPNARCIAITIAVAVLLEPTEVLVKESDFSKDSSQIRVEYRGLKAWFSDQPGEKSFNGIPVLTQINPERRTKIYISLKNLAITYDDHRADVKARKFLELYLSKVGDLTEKVAVLGFAWALLQKLEVKDGPSPFVIRWDELDTPTRFDREISVKDLGIWIGINGGVIVGSKFNHAVKE